MLKTKQSWRGLVWRSVRAGSLVGVSATVVACDGGTTGPDNRVVSVEVSASSASVPAGGTMQLSAAAKNASGATVSGKTFAWTSSNAGVASVGAAGLVTAIAQGSVTVTATETGSGKAGSMSLTVTPPPVASVSVTPATASINTGATQQLSATLKDASGGTLSGRTVTWTSSNAGVATVSSTGLVSGVAAGGPVTITATSEGRSGTAGITVLAVPVASVAVTPATATINTGATQQLSAMLKDASGGTLSGRAVTWTSSNAGVATVSSTGLVSGVAAGGPVTITATSEGKSGTASITVVVPQASSVVVAPRFAALDAGGSATITAKAFDASGKEIAGPGISWRSLSAGVATVSASGSVSGVTAGQASIVAQVNAATDTAWVAVLGPKSLLSTAFAGGAAKTGVKPGQTVTVPVLLDLSKASANGDLGSAQFELKYDPAVLVYQSATAGVTGSPAFNVSAPGTFKFSFAGTSPQGTAKLTLVTITFQVAPGASVGTQRALSLTYTAAPTGTEFQSYEIPISVGGRIQVVN